MARLLLRRRIGPEREPEKGARLFGNKKKQAAELMGSGATGVGTLTDVQDTGMTVNESIRVRMLVNIEPLDGSPAFVAEKKTMVSRVRVPPIGGRYPVYYDREDPSRFAMVMGIGDENARQTILGKFGDAFGADASGIGMPAVAAAPGAAAAPPDQLDQLKKLGELHQSGVLTDAEFAAQKAQILGTG
jgi:Short C-terminal domain